MYLSLSREYDGKKDQDWDGDDCSKDQPRLDAVQKCASFCLPAWLLKIRRANFEDMRNEDALLLMFGGWHEDGRRMTWGDMRVAGGWQEGNMLVTWGWDEESLLRMGGGMAAPTWKMTVPCSSFSARDSISCSFPSLMMSMMMMMMMWWWCWCW